MKTVGELIERNAASYPQRPAFVLEERSVSYAEYAAASRRVAAALYGLGMRRQDRVGVLSMNSIEFFEVYGACECAGFIAALYNFRIAAPELVHLVRDSAPRVVIFERQYLALVDAVRHELEGVEHWVCVEAGSPRAEPLPGWAESYEALAAQADPAGPPLRSDADDLAYIFYTSGTTGRAKGVPWTHGGALAMARLQGRHMGAGSRLLQITPAFHVGGKGFPLGAFWIAGTTVLTRSFDPLKFLQAIHRHRITTTFVVAPMLQAILECPQFDEFDVSSLRQVMAASAATPVPLLRRAVKALGPVFYTAYGSTECGNVAVLETHELRVDGNEDDVRRLGSVGHFLPEIDAAVLDDDGRPVPPGVVGEICARSPVFVGYWNNDPATIEATRDGWFRTGDLGTLDDEGFLFIVDRKKDMIISGGENIYSREVEEAITRHPAVAMVAVIGVPDAKWGEAVKALVMLRPQARVTEPELLDHCRAEIARYKCPRAIEFVAELPLTGTGKLDKVTLRKRYVAS